MNLPKPQRRGTILILGMLALSKKDVLMDKVDVMLKVGLGSRGKVSVDFHALVTILIAFIG
jgi:condensin complex subunit 1